MQVPGVAPVMRRLRPVVSAVRTTVVKPLRLRYADGGTLLTFKVQNALPKEKSVVRINFQGDVSINGKVIGNSYGSRNVGALMHERNVQRRQIIIVGEPSISGSRIENFITGINTSNSALVSQIEKHGMVFTSDYNLLKILQNCGVTAIKINPELEFTDKELLNVAAFFQDNPVMMKDFQSFTPRERTTVLRLLKNNVVAGLFNFWDGLTQPEKAQLLLDLSKVDIDTISRNMRVHGRYLATRGKDKRSNYERVKGKLGKPKMDEIIEMASLEASKRVLLAASGAKYKRSGRLGVVIMAAGAAQRFGQGPKALIEVAPGLTFMKAAADDVRKASVKAGIDIPLFIMVSPANEEAIRDHFEKNAFFGLNPDRVFFFRQDDILPKIYRTKDGGSLALKDKKRIDFAPTGHGFVVKGLKEQVLSTCLDLGLETLIIKNIDNLGSTVRDESYDEVLGHHLASKKGITVELVRPKVEINPETGEKKLLDPGGGAFSLDDRNVLMELSAVEEELQKQTVENPFNTLSITLDLQALRRIDYDAMPWYMVHKEITVLDDKWLRFQCEKFLGDITHQEPANFIIVEREGKKGRFVPVKKPNDLVPAREVFLKMDEEKG